MLTDAPPEGAGPLRVNVTVVGCPACTFDGLMEIPLSETEAGGAAVTVRVVDWIELPELAVMVTIVVDETLPADTR